VSELNHLRQNAIDELALRRDWDASSREAETRSKVESAVAAVGVERRLMPESLSRGRIVVQVYSVDDANAAADGGADEIVLDPFLRHPVPSVSAVTTLAASLAERNVALRLRTPTIVRPEDRRDLEKWIALDLPFLSGHLGLISELAAAGRDVTADYATNVFNSHTAAEVFRLGATRVVPSVELTTREMATLVEPWNGAGFETLVYGRPEGMTIEHCVLSAAFDREPTTCRDLCVKKHTDVRLTDPTGYTFAVATDSACRNRLLHSRPIEASEFLPDLWLAGIRGYHLVFNVPGDPVARIVAAYRAAVDKLAGLPTESGPTARELVGTAFTRGHFARAV
jgi:putative protease